MSLPVIYDVTGTLKHLPLSRNSLYSEIKAERLRAKQVGAKYLISETAILEWLGEVDLSNNDDDTGLNSGAVVPISDSLAPTPGTVSHG